MEENTTTEKNTSESSELNTFESFNLDARLLQAINQLKFSEPTPVQAKAIPLALNAKKDIIARAKTGSGKTAAYAIPIIHNILEEKNNSTNNSSDKFVKSLILVPTRELSEQVTKLFSSLTLYCGKQIKIANIGASTSIQVQQSLLQQIPDVVISTPSRALTQIKNNNLDVSKLKFFVIDEADLVVSYGHGDDLTNLSTLLPIKKNLQTWLLSATLNDEVSKLKESFCRNCVILKVENDDDDKNKLLQYYVKCNELDKFLLAYVIFKLHLIKGKTIIFVNDIDRGYRLKLFFEQFGIKSCILNAELPISSRLHIVEEFNKHVYNLLIATDEADKFANDEDDDIKEEPKDEEGDVKLLDVKETSKEEEEEEETKEEKEKPTTTNKKSKKSKKSKESRYKKDSEYGVSRGVDFRNVSCVLNFDLPLTSKSYTHRIGRTARAGKSGTALSFVVSKDQWGKHKASSLETAKRDEKILARIIKQQGKIDQKLEPYQFDMKQVEGFRYRMEDAFRAVTKVAIKEARIKEIKNELVTSEKLKRHFEENPTDLLNLRHDKELHPSRVQHHLKRIPDYLMPSAGSVKKNTITSFRNSQHNRVRKQKFTKRKGGKKRSDPLKSFRSR